MAQNGQRPFMAEIQRQRRAQDQPGTVDALSLPATTLNPAALAPLTPAQEIRLDTTEVMEAIQHLGQKLDRFLNTDHTQIEAIHVEIADIAGRIKATKLEMAALRHPLAKDDTFMEASQQLTAVVASTEAATNSIIQAAEEIDDIANEVRSQLPEGYQNSRLKDLNEVTLRIFEACNFQDLTGQRITKVVQALSFIEERIEAMMSVWNTKEFETMPLPPSIHKHDEGLELHGPVKDGGHTISQADIDALFD
ncbi:chemotaxis protein CheZ [Nitrospirillum amazonense]|uniref:Chemotaxis protein CheZ n=1 Tax=Nitrospirillum amazonense TaxID=28077 RepID=A0A560FJT6_9PROT|nr:protein phosphatase CheZ [Nitrospirillum amazonense]TWB21884.1 chemotaxis protein CheZ [Nitrospirillum amazonense]